MPPLSTRQRILASARRQFAAGGSEGVSLRRVAAQVGVTPMAIYRHFADRDALIDALVLDGLDRWAERLGEVAENDPVEWLVAAGDEFLAFALEEPSRFGAAFLVSSTRARRFPDDFATGQSPAAQLWLARLEQLRASGRLAAGVSPLEAGFTLWALAQGLVTLHRAGRFAGELDDFRAFYAKTTRRCMASFVVDMDVAAPTGAAARALTHGRTRKRAP
jgi:AcrR family transcriptional regulator